MRPMADQLSPSAGSCRRGDEAVPGGRLGRDRREGWVVWSCPPSCSSRRRTVDGLDVSASFDPWFLPLSGRERVAETGVEAGADAARMGQTRAAPGRRPRSVGEARRARRKGNAMARDVGQLNTIARAVLKPLFGFAWRIEVEGLDRLPADRRRHHGPQPPVGARPLRARRHPAPPHHVRRQGRVHGQLEDEVHLPGARHDPDRPVGRVGRRGRAQRRGRRARGRRAVRHLPRGHPLARRQAPQGPHRRGPPGAAHRLPDLPGRPAGHARGAAARLVDAQAVQGHAGAHRPPGQGRPLPRPGRRSPGAAPDHRRGHVRDPRAVGPGVRRHLRHQEERGRPGRDRGRRRGLGSAGGNGPGPTTVGQRPRAPTAHGRGSSPAGDSHADSLAG